MDEVLVAEAIPVETERHTYDLDFVAGQTHTNALYPTRYGVSQRGDTDGFDAEYHRPSVEKVTHRDGVDFRWKIDTHCASGRCMDSSARPTSVTKESKSGATVLATKQETYEYSDHPTKWVMGQLLSTTVNGTIVASVIYDPTYATMTQFSAFGQVQQTIVYDTTSAVDSGLRGTVTSVTDNNTNTTTFGQVTGKPWRRGIPQSITYADGTSETAAVNDFGWITSTSDELGNKTCYRQDLAGRTDLVTHPSEATTGTCDASTWAPTGIVYSKIASAEYGIPATFWKRTETTDLRVNETYYDALWRPMLERRSTTDSSAGTRAVHRRFDHQGRETFASYPDALATTNDSYTTLTDGVTTVYDALGRVTETRASSELGAPSTTTMSYLPGLQTQVLNPRGKITTTTYRAYDEPGYNMPMVITAPEGVTTTFTRDVYGKPKTLTRSGPGPWTDATCDGVQNTLCAVRRYVYDSQQRLCKTIEPDAGITVTGYDAAGNLGWRATGQNTLTSPTACGVVAESKKSIYTLDARNRVLGINHPNATADEAYTYDDDGALETASAGGGTWTYTYNKRRLLETESLAVDTRTFLLDWGYNARGDVSNLKYPSGLTVGFQAQCLR